MKGGVILRGELVPVTILESRSGSEGDWDIQTHVVFKAGTKTFRKTGRYQYHMGDAWDGQLWEVTPTETLVTVYVNKEEVVTLYTAAQVEAVIDAADVEWSYAEDWHAAGTYKDWRGDDVEQEDNRLRLDIDGETVYAEFAGGKMPAEGGGERVYAVIKVGDQFFQKNGYYARHYGTDWDGSLDEVHPVEKVVTIYETL